MENTDGRKQPAKGADGRKGAGGMTEADFQRYAAYVTQHFGIQLPPEKKALLESRLYKLFSHSDVFYDEKSFFSYLEQDKTGRAQKILADAITTNHTYFMRETDHFSCFADKVLPYWAERIRDGDVRTWCAACATGEEAYTLAMILQDFFSLREPHWETTLLATDLSEEALAAAREGCYAREAVQCMPPQWQSAYFHVEDDLHARVVASLRKKVLFRRFNLMQPVFPFKRAFHTIFCRNVMIYFDAPTRRELVRKFYDFLEPGGFLFVGHSEVVERQTAPLDYVMPSVYQKRA